MNAWLKTLAVVSVSPLVPALAAAQSECAPHVIVSPTKFPARSQLRGQEGIVFLDVKIDESGRVASTELARSSGYRLLDHAAQQSVQTDWRFDVSDCTRKDLPATERIAVEYRNDEYR